MFSDFVSKVIQKVTFGSDSFGSSLKTQKRSPITIKFAFVWLTASSATSSGTKLHAFQIFCCLSFVTCLVLQAAVKRGAVSYRGSISVQCDWSEGVVGRHLGFGSKLFGAETSELHILFRGYSIEMCETNRRQWLCLARLRFTDEKRERPSML